MQRVFQLRGENVPYKCAKCGSENVNVNANKRGALVGKCGDCGRFGNYGKQFEDKAGAEAAGKKDDGQGVKAPEAKSAKKPAAAGGRSDSGAGQRGKPSGGRRRVALGDKGSLQRSGSGGEGNADPLLDAIKRGIGWLVS
jgi:DNA-directed RNA polymerase subunit RPC12/RpoP